MQREVPLKPHPHDEFLAQLTDDLLADSLADDVRMDTSDPDLQELLDTSKLLWSLLGREEPDDAMRERIHQNLMVEWRDMNKRRQAVPVWKKWWSRTFANAPSPVVRTGLVIASALATLLLIIGVGLAAVPAAGEVSGAAGGTGSYALIAIGAGGLLLVLAWVFGNKRS